MDVNTNILRLKVAKYFQAVDASDANNYNFVCKINNCDKVLRGKQPSNLTTHAKNSHKDFYEANIKRPVSNPTEFAIKRLKFIQHCAEIIAINGCTFELLCKSGFKNLVAEKVADLVEAGYGEGITAQRYTAVRRHIGYQASQIEAQIKTELKGKFVAIMVDAASKNGQSYLGITLQFVHDGVVMVRHAGIIEILHSHTAVNLMNALMERLIFFGIEKKQIIAITTDNERSMTAMVKRINTWTADDADDAALGDDAASGDETALSEDEDGSEDDDSYFGGNENVNSENEDELNELLDDNPEFQALILKCLDDYAIQTMDIYGIRCAAHTLQLAIRETMTASTYQRLITVFRDVAKYLRKPTSRRIMKEQRIRIWLPRMDCETRWSSFYRMVKKIIL